MVSLVAGEPLSEAHPAVGVRVVVVVFMVVGLGTLTLSDAAPQGVKLENQGLGNGSRI